MKTTFLGGLLFLVPVAFLTIIFGKAFQLSMAVVKPVDELMPVETVAGVAAINLVAIFLIAALCFLAGLAAQRGWIGKRLDRLDGLLLDIIPGYAVAKGMVGSVANDEDASTLKPVHVRFDDFDQIALEVERDATHATLFLPGTPSTWSGSTVIVTLDRISPINLPMHQVVKLMRVMGRGSLAVKQHIN